MGDRKRYKWIPFLEPQDTNTYMKLHRSKDPLQTAVELDIVDLQELKKRTKKVERTFKKLGLLLGCCAVGYLNINLWLGFTLQLLHTLK